MARQPELFPLDEPTCGNLDPANEARLMENLVDVAARCHRPLHDSFDGKHLFCWHNVSALGRLPLDEGAVAYAGPPQELLSTLGCRVFADLYERLERGQFEPLGIPEPISDQESHSGASHQIVSEVVPEQSGNGRHAAIRSGQSAIQHKTGGGSRRSQSRFSAYCAFPLGATDGCGG